MSTRGSNTVDIITLVQGSNPNKAEIIENAEAAPLYVREELRGNGEAEAGVALDMGWNSTKGSVRMVVSGKIQCDSHPETHLKAYDHVHSIVTAVVSDKLPQLKALMESINLTDVGG